MIILMCHYTFAILLFTIEFYKHTVSQSYDCVFLDKIALFIERNSRLLVEESQCYCTQNPKPSHNYLESTI